MSHEIRKTTYQIQPPARTSKGDGQAAPSPQNGKAQTKAVNAAPKAAPKQTSLAASAAADVRLVIEKDALGDGFVYKSVDRATGKVLQQFPREEVLRAIAAARTAEGLIVDTKA